MKNQTSRKAGFTLVEIMIVVAIIGLLAAIAIPNFVRARATSQANACINNLRQVDGAKQQWALEQNKVGTDTPVASDIAIYLGRGAAGQTLNVAGGQVANQINCPASGTYTINNVQTPPTCSLTATAPKHALPN
jgi:general secretion pathway protein G